jgi:hypothetical protein
MGEVVGKGKIVTNGLVLSLDAADRNSYVSGSTTWRDLSGNGRNFTLTNGPTFSSENGGAIVFAGDNDVLVGPASNTFNLTQEHTIEAAFKVTQIKSATLFNWVDSSATSQIFGLVPFSDGNVYYDNLNSRVIYNSANLLNRVVYMVFKRNTSVTPYMEIYENNIQKASSGASSVNNMTFGTAAALIGAQTSGGSAAWQGNLYFFRMYNRALSPSEILQNYNATKSRFGL